MDYLDLDDVNEDNRADLYSWVDDQEGFGEDAALAAALHENQTNSYEDLIESEAEEQAKRNGFFAKVDEPEFDHDQLEVEEKQAKPTREGSSRIEYYTNSTGYEVNPEPNEHGIVLPDWALEKVEQCVSIFMGEQGWRVRKDGYHRGDLVSMTVAMLLDDRAKIEGADFLYHVRRAADYLLSPQFVGQKTNDCTLFRKGGEKAKTYKPIGTQPGSLNEVSDLLLGGLSMSGTCGGNTGATIQAGSSIRYAYADKARKMTTHDILSEMPIAACHPNHHRQVEARVFWADQMEVMTNEGNGEYAAVLEMVVNDWTLAEIASQMGYSVSTACRKKDKAGELWKELNNRENGTYRKRKKLQKFLNEVRARRLSEARAEHQIYLDGVKREQRLQRQQSLIKSLRLAGLSRKKRGVKANPVIPKCHLQTSESFVGLN
ncbi:hypothetical protein N9Z44_01090 [Mariniblastus sp.]|nr:hypothetical protein [Mariniblastus sp.]